MGREEAGGKGGSHQFGERKPKKKFWNRFDFFFPLPDVERHVERIVRADRSTNNSENEFEERFWCLRLSPLEHHTSETETPKNPNTKHIKCAAAEDEDSAAAVVVASAVAVAAVASVVREAVAAAVASEVAVAAAVVVVAAALEEAAVAVAALATTRPRGKPSSLTRALRACTS